MKSLIFNHTYLSFSSLNGGAFVDRIYIKILANANINGINQTVNGLSIIIFEIKSLG